LEGISIVDVSKIGHIVYACNVKTVQQKYAKDENEEEIGSAPQKGERETQEYGVSLPFQQFQNLQDDG